MRIEKHNIEIRKLKLEVAQERYRHLKKWSPMDESAAGQNLVVERSNKEDKPDITSKKLLYTAKTMGKRTISKAQNRLKCLEKARDAVSAPRIPAGKAMV